MKKINYVYVVFFLVFVSLMSEGLGWTNVAIDGKEAYNREYGPGGYYDLHLEHWEVYDYSYDYSSHDWMADKARGLCELSPYFSKWSDDQDKPFWDAEGRRRDIFLYATAGPDYGNCIRIRSKAGMWIQSTDDKLQHYYRFDNNKHTSFAGLGTLALEAGRKAVKAIKSGDCDLGAFYLGHMVHYIADASLYVHVIGGVKTHSNIELFMSGRMDSCPGVARESSFAKYSELSQYEFVYVSTLPIMVFPLEPDKCTKVVAYDTAFDASMVSGGEGTYTAKWMDDTFYSIDAVVKQKAKSRLDWKSWSNALPIADGTNYYNAYHFFNKLEQSIDLGVWYIANAMTWVIKNVGPYKCTLGVQDLKQSVSKQISLGVIFMLLSYLGISLIDYFMRSSDSIWIAIFEGFI